MLKIFFRDDAEAILEGGTLATPVLTSLLDWIDTPTVWHFFRVRYYLPPVQIYYQKLKKLMLRPVIMAAFVHIFRLRLTTIRGVPTTATSSVEAPAVLLT